MDKIFQIKEKFKTTVIGFNNSGLPLGERDDLDKLAEMAQHNPAIAEVFVNCPTREQLKAWKEKKFLAATEVKPEPKIITPEPSVTPPVEKEKEK